MRPLSSFIGIFVTFLMLKDMADVQAAALICSDNKPIVDLADHKVNMDNNNNKTEEYKRQNEEGSKNSLNKLFHNIQCTLEKAKPWVAELQQEAKRLEEAAKLLGLGILNSFGEFVDKLVDDIPPTTTNNTLNDEFIDLTENSTEEISQYLCPDGFVADHNGICERVN
ncbi:uncharacterized protein ACRADG_009202 [Cochliomyia hominivorax]